MGGQDMSESIAWVICYAVATIAYATISPVKQLRPLWLALIAIIFWPIILPLFILYTGTTSIIDGIKRYKEDRT